MGVKNMTQRRNMPALLSALFLLAALAAGCGGSEKGQTDAGPLSDAQGDGADPTCLNNKHCDDGNPCTQDRCENSACSYTTPDETIGQACSDHDLCTTASSCQADGSCGGGAPIDLPEDPCVLYSCDPETGVSSLSKNQGAPCDDGDCCTLVDTCLPCPEGDDNCAPGTLACAGSPKQCTDVNDCTTETCECQDEVPVCVFPPVEDGTPCDAPLVACTTGDQCQAGQCMPGPEDKLDDGNPCTQDLCEKGDLVHLPLSDPFIQCDDGDNCTMLDHCVVGACVGGAPLVCAPSLCAQSATCSNGACQQHWLEQGASCNDGNACTVDETCGPEHICTSLVSLQCNDFNPCTTDWCDAVTGDCKHQPEPGLACDDGFLCTTADACTDDGQCQGTAVQCSADLNPCVKPVCNSETGQCDIFQPEATPCQFEDPCLGQGECTAGQCVSLGGPCQSDCLTGACTNVLGVAICQKLPDLIPCSDGNPKSAFDQCIDGECVGWCAMGSIGSPCTPDNDLCEANCGDGNPCNGLLSCQDGKCLLTPDTEVICPAPPLPCYENICTPDTGECQLLPLADGTKCVSGNPCFVGEQLCVGALCLGGADVDCNDDNPCTEDSCDSETACVHTPLDAECDDGNACTLDDECNADGQCSGSLVECPPAPAPCQLAVCNTSTGECQAESVPDCCGNGLVEGEEQCDDGNVVDDDSCSNACVSLCNPECDGSVCAQDGCGAKCQPCPVFLTQGPLADYVLHDEYAYVAFVGDYAAVGRVALAGGDLQVLTPAQTAPRDLTVDAKHLFWVATTPDGAVVRRVPAAGGNVDTLYQSPTSLRQILVSADQLYFWEYSTPQDASIVALPAAGGQAQILVENVNSQYSLLLQDEEAIYWATWGPEAAVYKLPKKGGEPLMLAQTPWATRPALDAGYLYLSTGPEDNSSDAIVRVATVDGQMDVLVSGQPNAFEVVVNSSSVYWYAGQSAITIKTALKDGGEVATVAHPGYGGLGSLAVDSNHVWWIDSGSHPENAAVFRAAAAGSQPLLLAADQPYATQLNMSEDRVFWRVPGPQGGLVVTGK